jgi:hypothetical protein
LIAFKSNSEGALCAPSGKPPAGERSVLPTTKITNDMVSHDDLTQLREDIIAAFADAQRPTEDDIVVHECDECRALEAAFAPLTWDAVPDSVIEAHASELPLFSPTAFAYFLPAYLLYTLAHFTPRADAAEHTVYALTPNDPPNVDMADWHRERFKPFTQAQVTVAERFLELVEADDEFSRYMGSLTDGRVKFREFWDTRWSA